MGASLGGLFSGVGQGSNFNVATGQYDPSTLQKLVQGTAKGAGAALGKSMQTQGRTASPGAGGTPGAPSATPVDSSYFTPTAGTMAMPPGTTAGRPMPPNAMPAAAPPSPAFYSMMPQ